MKLYESHLQVLDIIDYLDFVGINLSVVHSESSTCLYFFNKECTIKYQLHLIDSERNIFTFGVSYNGNEHLTLSYTSKKTHIANLNQFKGLYFKIRKELITTLDAFKANYPKGKDGGIVYESSIS